MPQTLFIFDFGVNEESAQQARHRLEGWRQAFRLGDRLQFKFERQSAPATAESAGDDSGKTKKKGSRGESKAADAPAEKSPESVSERLRLLVRLEFSSHEKLSYQRWLDRLGAEPPFQQTEKQVLRPGQEGFDSATETFDSLR
jgi:hypothetical protein